MVDVEGNIFVAALVARKLQKANKLISNFLLLINFTLLLQNCILEELFNIQIEHLEAMLMLALFLIEAMLRLRWRQPITLGGILHRLLC